MGTETNATIRQATEDDVDFIAWDMLCASRSHLPRGIWEVMNDQSEEQALDLLRNMAVTDTVHFCHWSTFLVAEVDGRPVAGLCGFDPEREGFGALMSVMPPLYAKAEVLIDERFGARAAAINAVNPEHPADAWVVENVATLPAYRRRGLTDALLEAILERGRGRGFELAQIAVFIGNAPARNAYIKAGFEYVDEKRDDAFEAAMGSPGIERLVRPI